METVLHAPFAGRVKELLVSDRAARSRPARRWCASSRSATDRGGRGRRRTRVRTSTCPSAAVDGDPAQRAARGLGGPARDACSATTSTRTTEGGALAGLPRRRGTRWPTAGSTCVHDELELLRRLRRPRRAQPQPAGRRGGAHRAARAQPARALPHLPAEPRRRARRACPSDFRDRLDAGARALRRRPSSTAPPRSRRRSSGSSSPSSAPTPEVALVTALLQRWIAEPAPRPPADADGRATLLDRLGRATQLRFPIVGDLARSVRFRWFDQPLVDADRAGVLAGVRDELDELDAPTPDAPDRPERIDALAAIPEQIVRFLGRAARRRRRRAGADARGARQAALPRATTCTTCASPGRRRAARSPSPTTARRPRRPSWSPPIGTVDGADDPDGALAGLVGRARSRPGPTATTPSSTSTCTWPGAPADPRGGSRRSCRPARRRRRLRRTTSAGSPWRSCPGDGRPVGLLHVPRPAGRRHARRGRPPVRGVHPMVGRRLNLWRLRDFDVTRLEAPEDVLLYHCVARGQPGRPAARRARPGAPAGRRPRRRRAGHGPAARRARGGELPRGDPPGARGARRRRRQARHEPRVGARLARRRRRPRPADRARRARSRPLTDGAGHRGGAAAGPGRRRPDGHPVADRASASRYQPGRRGRRHRRAAADRAAASRSTTTPSKVRPRPAPRPRLPLRARAPMLTGAGGSARRARPRRHRRARARSTVRAG